MKKFIVALFLFIAFIISVSSTAQCSVCSRTAEQLGEEPARGMNAGVLYLALTPFAIAAVIAYKLWKRDQ